jgi:predicted phage terminase large subunit-like protein
MPPRHGKTELGTRRFPGWYFGNYNNKSILSISYNKDLAEEFGADARDVIASNEYGQIFDIRLSQENAAKTKWKLVSDKHRDVPCNKCNAIDWNHKTFGRSICNNCGSLGEFPSAHVIGKFNATGIDGTTSGRGADILDIDDPIKNRKEAESKTYRKNVWDQYASSLRTRLQKDAKIIMILTRWHEDDLAGMVLRQGVEDWYELRLPAIAEEDEEYRIFNKDYQKILGNSVVTRRKGEALWESDFPLDELLKVKDILGSYEFSALYQQRPQPAEGGLFKTELIRDAVLEGDILRLYSSGIYKNMELRNCTIYGTMDLGITDGSNSDFTVLSTWAVTPDNDIVLIDLDMQKIEAADHLDLIFKSYFRWKHNLIGIEATQYQLSLVQQAMKNNLPAKALHPKGNKTARALPAAARVESGKIYFLRNLNNKDEAINQLKGFPSAVHDDFVDTMSYIVELLGDTTKLHVGFPKIYRNLVNKR